MTRRILLLDLDRTLFVTPDFMVALWGAIGKEFHIDVTASLAGVMTWYRNVGDMQYYSFEEHAKHLLGISGEEVGEIVRPYLTGKNFLYSDTHEIKKWQARGDYELRILSFGMPWFQTFKLSFTPELRDMPVDIVLEPKATFIARAFGDDATGFLVDDRLNAGMPPGFKEVWLNRLTDKKKPGIITIHSLTQIQEIL